MSEAPRPPSTIDAVAPYVEGASPYAAAAIDAAFFVVRVAAATGAALALAYRLKSFERTYAYATIETILAAAALCPR